VPAFAWEGADGADAPLFDLIKGTNGVVKGLLDDINPQSTDGSAAGTRLPVPGRAAKEL
jgi:hypothetical protein